MDIELHSRERQLELGRALSGRRKIYLDACFWIVLRDTALGLRSGPDERKLLHFLRRGVRDGALVCPISASMFLELLKQPFIATRRRATAQLIDELSLGVTAITPHVLLGTEIHRFLLQVKGDVSLYAMQELIWTKVAYVLGDQYPSIVGLSPDKELALQKAFFDHLWGYPLVDIVDTIGDANIPSDEYGQLSKETNEQNQRYRDELKSFEGTYDIELRGAVDVAGEIAADVIAYLESKNAGRTTRPSAAERVETTAVCRNFLYFAMKKPEHRNALRTLHIGASLHAAMRWDKERRFKPNDYYDVQHATVALSYCDAFLTEKPLHFLVTRPHVDLEKVNLCRVISDISVAADYARECALGR